MAENSSESSSPQDVPASVPPVSPEPPVGVPPEHPQDVPPNARTMAMLSHLLGIASFPGPLIVWLIKKDEHPFIDQQGKEALNWQLTILIAITAGSVLSWIPLPLVGRLIWLILIALWTANVVFCIMGAVKANEGKPHAYPVKIPFVK